MFIVIEIYVVCFFISVSFLVVVFCGFRCFVYRVVAKRVGVVIGGIIGRIYVFAENRIDDFVAVVF